jgi:putative SOS response-associated peptidase YedK
MTMCGRFFLISKGSEIAERFRLVEEPLIQPRYNISPGQMVALVRRDPKGLDLNRLLNVSWGLVPSWSQGTSPGKRFINARSESVREKPAFRGAFRSRRCLIPANGFFEWSAGAAEKIPYVIQLRDGGLTALAGLWDRWTSDQGEVLESCAVLTTQANELVGTLHDRMPVILDVQDFDPWVDSDYHDRDLFERLFRPYASEKMECYPVGKRVNSSRYEGPECITRLSFCPEKT